MQTDDFQNPLLCPESLTLVPSTLEIVSQALCKISPMPVNFLLSLLFLSVNSSRWAWLLWKPPVVYKIIPDVHVRLLGIETRIQ